MNKCRLFASIVTSIIIPSLLYSNTLWAGPFSHEKETLSANSLIKFWESNRWPVNEAFDVYDRLSKIQPLVLEGSGDIEAIDKAVRNPLYEDGLKFSYNISLINGLFKMPVSLYRKRYIVLFYKKDDPESIDKLRDRYGLKDTDVDFAKRGFWIYAEDELSEGIAKGISTQKISLGRRKVEIGSLVSRKLIRDAQNLYNEVITRNYDNSVLDPYKWILIDIGEVIRYLAENERVIWVKGLGGPARYQVIKNTDTDEHKLYVLLDESLRNAISGLSDKGTAIRIAKELVHEAVEVLLERDGSDPEERKTEIAALTMETIFLNLVHNTHTKWTTNPADSEEVYIGKSRYLTKMHKPKKGFAIDVLFGCLAVYGLRLLKSYSSGMDIKDYIKSILEKRRTEVGADSKDEIGDDIGSMRNLLINLFFRINSYDKQRDVINLSWDWIKILSWGALVTILVGNSYFITAGIIVAAIVLTMIYLVVSNISKNTAKTITSAKPKAGRFKFLTGFVYLMMAGLIVTGAGAFLVMSFYLIFNYLILPFGQTFSLFILITSIAAITVLLVRNIYICLKDVTFEDFVEVMKKTAYNIFISPFDKYFGQDMPDSSSSYHIRQNRTKQMLALSYYRGMALSSIFHLVVYYIDNAEWLYRISTFFFVFFSLAAVFAFVYSGIVYISYKIKPSLSSRKYDDILQALHRLDLQLEFRDLKDMSRIIKRKVGEEDILYPNGFVEALGRLLVDVNAIVDTYSGVEFFVRTDSNLLWDFLTDDKDIDKRIFRRILFKSIQLRSRRLFISNRKGEIVILEGEDIAYYQAGHDLGDLMKVQSSEMAGRLLNALEEIEGGLRGYKNRMSINGDVVYLLSFMTVYCGNRMQKRIAVINPSKSIKYNKQTAKLYDAGAVRLERKGADGSTASHFSDPAIPQALLILTHPEFGRLVGDYMDSLKMAYARTNSDRLREIIRRIKTKLENFIPEIELPPDGAIMRKGGEGKAFEAFLRNKEEGKYKLLNETDTNIWQEVVRVASEKSILLDGVKIYAINSIAKAKDDFVHGYYDRGANELFLSLDIINKAKAYDNKYGTKLLDEYVEHELKCNGVNHQELRIQQRRSYRQFGNYNDDSDEGCLRDIIREDIDIRVIASQFMEKVKAVKERKVILALDTNIGDIRDTEELLKQIRDVSDLLGNIELIAKEDLSEGDIEARVGALTDAGITRDDIKVIVITGKEGFSGYNVTRVKDNNISTKSGEYVPILEIITFALSLYLEEQSDSRDRQLMELYKVITGKELKDLRSIIIELPGIKKISVDIYKTAEEVLASA